MILISHRGNITGPDPSQENSPLYVQQAIGEKYMCEIDVWRLGKTLFLGHNEPTYLVHPTFLTNPYLWCHAKNFEALTYMLSKGIHCFWHQEDDLTLTSRGFIWTHMKRSESKYLVPSHSIAVMPEWNSNRDFIPHCAGVCSDYIETYK